MEQFKYKARKRDGAVVYGTVNAPNEAAVAAFIRKQDMYVAGIEASKKKGLFSGVLFEESINLYDISIFARQFATLLGAGVPLLTGLEILTQQSAKERLRTVLGQITTSVREGKALSAAMAEFPKVFPELMTNMVAAGEAGGITQHIGAYRVMVNGKPVTFLDTPGHEAFTTMRARGAQVTDIAILVVAADDGIMPQTVEAIHHAKAAGVSVIVAINKMDKVGANPENVKQQLTEYELIPEEWGGDTPCIPVSAKTKEGLDDLLEMVTLVAEMKELKANPDRAAKGTVIEARLDKGRGPIATVLVQNGTLHKGDTIIAGTCVGRVRVMTNDKGERVTEAGPSVPVEITGLDEVPVGGDIFDAVSDERLARTLVDQRKAAKKEEIFNAQTKVTLDNLFDQMKLGEIKELQIIVKADVQGSAEAVKQSLEKLSNDEVRVNVIHSAVGAINESDVMLAEASNAIIVGFNVRPDAVAAENAERSGVDMRLYSIIYDCINEIESAMKGMLAPKTREVVLGMAECRNVIKIKSVGTIAGSYVKSGKIQRGASVRVIRDGIVIADDAIASLQRFKDAVKEVSEGYECGIGLERFNDLKEGDMFEVYTIEEYRD